MDGARAVNHYVNDAFDSRMLPETKNKATALEGYASTLGILFGYPDYSGWRSQADTTNLIKWRNEAVQEGGPSAWYPVSPYGVGYHGKGAAFDIKVVHWPDGKTSDWAYQTLGAFASKIGLRWGGNFVGTTTVNGKQVSKKDPYHFELAISLADAQTRFDAWQLQQKQTQLSGKPAVVVTPSVPSTPTLTFKGFQLPTDLNALPKSLSDIESIIKKPTGAIALGVVVALAVVAVGFTLIPLAVNVLR